MIKQTDPVAVPLSGLSVNQARPTASRKQMADFLHSAPHIADALTRPVVPASEETFDHVPDHAPTTTPAPRGF